MVSKDEDFLFLANEPGAAGRLRLLAAGESEAEEGHASPRRASMVGSGTATIVTYDGPVRSPGKFVPGVVSL